MSKRTVAGERQIFAPARSPRVVSGVAAAVAFALAGAAIAAESPAPTGQLEEIVVRAERRDTNLQSTPIAVSALNEQLIADVAPKTISDLAAYVPNFSANKINGFNAASFAMRGVGNTDIIVYNEAPVAVLVDDFVMPSVQTQILDSFDVAQVEVLRGPQGTLFGKNTTGGAVVVRTKAPSLTEAGVEVQGQAGNLGVVNMQGALNVPIVDGKLGLRLVASSEKEDGWISNGSSNTIGTTTYTGDGKTYGGTKVLTGRAKLLWQATDNMRTQITYEVVRDRSQAPIAVNTTPTNLSPTSGLPYYVFALLGLPGHTSGDPYSQGGTTNRDGYLINMPDGHRVDVDGIYVNSDFTVTGGTITWVQGYRSQDSSLPSNYTGIVGPLSVFDANRSDRRKTWQEELRFASTAGEHANYVLGAFFQHDDTKFCVAQILGIYDLFGVPTPAGATPGGYNNNPQVLCNAQQERSAAAFGEMNYKFNDKATLTLGARYTNDVKDWTGRQQVFVQQLPSANGAFDPAFTYQQLGSLMAAANFAAFPFGVVTNNHSWTEPTYRASFSYQFNRDLFGYATYSHGFRAGGYNDQVGTSGAPITKDEAAPTNPEKADSFEVGFKSEWLNRSLRTNVAAFYVTYKDAIRQVVVPVTNANGQPGEETLFRNAAKLKVYGLESEISAKLGDSFTLRLPFSFQHCSYDSFSSGTTAGGDYVDLSGLDVNRCPKVTATLDGTYTLLLAGAGRVVFDASANYVGKNLDTYSIALPYASFTQTFADARTLINASVTYRSADDHWFVRALARNLGDKRYVGSAQNVDPLWVWSFYGEPRYFGGEVGFKFGKTN
ncbi:MAG: TonB-dependent receptor [Proteobacteria bacterium]|nr:TonB-dependent receptor [Pseudomonadota bacterium]